MPKKSHGIIIDRVFVHEHPKAIFHNVRAYGLGGQVAISFRTMSAEALAEEMVILNSTTKNLHGWRCESIETL